MKISEQVQSKAISIHEILKDSNKVNIPFFQRQYVWKFDEHIINLINDITLNNTAYYLGSVIFKSKFDKYLIIDGQQRFTTLLLISKSLYLHELLNEKNKLEIEYILNEIKFDSFNVQNKNTLKKILSLQQSVFDEKQKNTSYYVNFNKILDYFKKWDAKKINHFYSNLYQKTFITRTIIENSLDENIIFSKINSTGEALTAIDMFKNNILSKISEEKKSIDSSYDEEEFIKQKLESFETTTSYLEKPNEKDNLLRNFIAYKTFRLENKQAKKIYNSYLKLIEQENEFEHFFDSFIEFGLYQKYLIQSQKYLSKDLNPVELSIIKNNIQTFIVLLIDIFKKFSKYYKTELEIKINDSKDRDNIRECLKVIEYYIISKAFVGDSLKVITRLIPAIHKENKKINNSSNYHEYLYDVLINSSLIEDDKNQYKSPTRSKFRHDFLTFDIYKKNRNIIKSFFIRLISHNNKTNYNFDNFSVEHIYPQDSSNWNMDLEEKQKCSNLLNSIGNLTLTSYNSEYSNHNFESKKKKMIQKDEPKFNEYLTNVNEWNSKEIIKRAEWLFDEYVDKIWSFNYTDKSNKYNTKNKIDEANESLKRKECFDKNKSYFKNHIFNYDVVCLFLKSYFEKGLNLVQTENEILKTSYKGWVTKSIIDYLILDKKNIDINKWIDNNKNLIDEFVDDINNS